MIPAACSSEPELQRNGDCETASDCGDDGVCVDGSCTNRCGSHEDCGPNKYCSVDFACETQCATCGQACEETEECPAGQFCLRDSCQQECTPGEGKASECDGRACSDDGQCASNDDIEIGEGGAGGGSGDGDDTNEDCIDVEVTFEPQIPNVVLLIDRSGSMNDGGGFGAAVDAARAAGTYVDGDCTANPNWRYNVVRNILLNPDHGIVKPLENDVRFGMALYSSPEDASLTCPELLEVGLGFGTQEAMLAEFKCDDYLRHTPSRESLTATAEKLAALDVEGPKVIVFATDGAPDNCACRDWDDGYGSECDQNDSNNDVMLGGEMRNTAEAEQYRVVEEAARIYEDLGITIEVINVSTPGDATLAAHLDDVAERGGAVSGASIDGFDPGALTDAFQSIIDGVRSCAIDLDGEISAGKESTGKVTLDGKGLVLNDEDGWKVNSPTQIELVGEACETIKTGDHDLDVSFPCGSFVVVAK